MNTFPYPSRLDKIKDKLGGEWYDIWWLAIAERFDPMSELSDWEPNFFQHINRGWLEMYYEV